MTSLAKRAWLGKTLALSLLIAVFALASASSAAESGRGSGYSAMYEYRYAQAVEQEGLANDNAKEGMWSDYTREGTSLKSDLSKVADKKKTEINLRKSDAYSGCVTCTMCYQTSCAGSFTCGGHTCNGSWTCGTTCYGSYDTCSGPNYTACCI